MCKQVEGERNYHIFYHLLAGAPPDMRNALMLDDKASYEVHVYFCIPYIIVVVLTYSIFILPVEHSKALIRTRKAIVLLCRQWNALE